MSTWRFLFWLIWLVTPFFCAITQTQCSDPNADLKKILVPLEFCREHGVFLVPVTMRGRIYRFILDTGSEYTVVSAEASGVSAVELRRAEFDRSGPGMRGFAVPIVMTLAIGDSRPVELEVRVMDMKLVREIYGKVDGLLGQDFLKEFSHVTIDRKDMRLVLEQ